MQAKNICKFTSPFYTENLSAYCFVLESNEDIMQTPKNLSYYRMLLVLEGEGDIFFGKKSFQFNTGSLFFGFKGEDFYAKCREATKYMYIDFEGLRAENLLKRFNINENNRCFLGFDGLIPLWKESLSRASKNTIDIASESIILYTLSRFSEERLEKDSITNKILGITEEQFNNFELSLSVIADELGYNSKYLSHLFKKKMNISYTEYLRHLRIKYAVALFDQGLDSVKNVALLSGFADPLYFSTIFKKSTGLSPKEYLSKDKKQ